MDKYNINSHKLLWHLDRLSNWMKNKRINPIHIQLGISSWCNSNCIYCYGKEYGQTLSSDRYDMPLNVMQSLFYDAKDIGVESITLVGEGENTLNPNFYDIIKYAKLIDIDLGLATNGILFKEEYLDYFVWIRFNISTGTRESYKSIHQIDAYEKVVSNIEKCVKYKKEHHLNTTIGLQMVLLKDNIKDIIPLVKLGKKLKVDYVVIKPCADTPNRKFSAPFDEYLKLDDIFKEAESYNDTNYSVIIKRNKFESGENHPFKVCYATQFAISIDSKGNVAPCCHLLGYRKEDFNMGNIHTASLKDIVKSERYWFVQNKVQELNIDKECETNCMHYYMCEFLEGLKHPPEHVNFV